MNDTIYGYNGKVLRANLSKGMLTAEPIDEAFCRKYLGGAGFISYYLWKELPQGIDPLGPDNKLIFALGTATGFPLAGSGRHCVGAKSPLTGGIAKSEPGGFWGAELKRAGFDAIIVEGKAPEPVYLWIHDGDVSLRKASPIWGQDTKETQQAIRDELGDQKIQLALIGPAGENLVRYSVIMHGLFDAAGRGGTGAVMGSKNLKAIAVRGRKLPSSAKPEGIKELREWLSNNMNLVKGYRDFGTSGRIIEFEKLGNLPTRNFQDGAFAAVERISGQTLKATIGVGMDGCFACPVRCKKRVAFQEPYPVDPDYGGPEYETQGALGSNCGVEDLKAISLASQLCNAYSLDVISTGCTIAFAMECFENGLLTSKDTGGMELRFGNAEAMLQTIKLIAKREGIGNLLAEGSARAAERIGPAARALAIHVKKQEIPMHEPRLNKALGLGYMVNPHGADHCCNMIDILFNGLSSTADIVLKDMIPLGWVEPVPLDDISPRKVSLFRMLHLKRIAFDSLGICQFLPYSFQQVADLASAITGWDIGPMGLARVSERVLTLYRLFNIREGFSADDDKLPNRFFHPTKYGPLAHTALDPEKMEKAKRYYYSLMGWDANTGKPMPETIEALSIP
jgi:aldehyde:ferredoxin oxidoreductase